MEYVSALEERTNPNSVIHGADANEPVFVLRGQDPIAKQAIQWWIWCATNRGVSESKLASAQRQLRVFDSWHPQHVPKEMTEGPVVGTAFMERTSQESTLNRMSDNEPVFVLVASDCVATEAVEFWAYQAHQNAYPKSVVASALYVVSAMARWDNKRLAGQRRYYLSGEINKIELPALGVIENKSHAFLVCSSCDHEKYLASPPYCEKIISSLSENLQKACEKCGAKNEAGQHKLFMTYKAEVF